jgi:hypothetical protein
MGGGAHTSLGLVLDRSSTGDSRSNRKEAIESFQKAEAISVKAAHRPEWARIRLNQAKALGHLAEGGPKNCSGLWQAMGYVKSVLRDPLPAHSRTRLEPEVEATRSSLSAAWSAQGCGDPEALADVPVAK